MNTRKSRKTGKKRWKIAGITAASLLCYLIVGATAPFVRYKTVTKEDRKAVPFPESGSGDRAMLLETNRSAWEERIRLMNLAKERIIISTFDVREGESTSDLFSLLYHKAEEGVSVKLLVDGFNSVLRMEGSPFFYALSSHPNVEVRIYNKLNPLLPWKTQGRMHNKYVIVDDLAYLLGGRNMFDYFIGEYPTENRSSDREALIYNGRHGQADSADSSLFGLEEYFDSVWNRKECSLFHDEEELQQKEEVREQIAFLQDRYEIVRRNRPDLFEEYDYTAHSFETEGVTLLSGETGIYGKKPVVFAQLAQLMMQAKERVIIHTPYAVCNTYMYDTLKKIHGRVPVCRIVLNSVENGDNFMASGDYLYHKKDLVDTGIQLYEYDGGDSYHGKSIVIDGDISLIGSYNLDLRSTYMDTELMLMVRSSGLTQELSANMEKIERDCRKVLDADTYQVPTHITVAPIPPLRRISMRIVGFLMQPFRYLI